MQPLNEEQLNVILAVLAAYRGGEMELYRLPEELMAGHHGFVSPPKNWTERFFPQWLVIETLNAITLDGGDMSETGKRELDDAINAIHDLAIEHLSNIRG